MKKRRIAKLICLALCTAMMLPALFACGGDKDEGSDTTTTTAGGEAPSITEATTTEAPTTTEPAPTEPPPTMPPIDPSLPYYDQMDAEFAFYGFTGGEDAIAVGEEETMKKLSTSGVTKTELTDIQGVPFKYGYNIDIKTVPADFWNAKIERTLRSDLTVAEGDIIAGVVWVRNTSGDTPPTIHYGLKTATDNWGSEGQMNLAVDTLIEHPEWHKMYFYGYILNQESSASNVAFSMFVGFDISSFDIGGLYIKRFPYSEANDLATMNMPAYE